MHEEASHLSEWLERPDPLTAGFSLEISAKDVESLRKAAPDIPPQTPIAIAFLPGEYLEARLGAIRTVRTLGFEPLPHFSARRLGSSAEFKLYLNRAVNEGGVTRCFVVAGDPPESMGPYHDSSALIQTGEFEQAGIKAIGVGGHPEGHPSMSIGTGWEVLSRKCHEIESRGMEAFIMTQFVFDPDVILAWLRDLRVQAIHSPVRIGVPGPASVARLIRFAARCGVAASSAVMSRYGVSLSKLVGTAGPDKLVNALAEGLRPEHGSVRLHFYPFGGIERTVNWIAQHADARRA